MAEERGGECDWEEGDVLLGRAPRAEGVGLMAADVLLVEPDGELVGGAGDELDEMSAEGG